MQIVRVPASIATSSCRRRPARCADRNIGQRLASSCRCGGRYRPKAAICFCISQKGRVAIQGVNADKIEQELTAAGGDARMFREFALGFNPALKVLPEAPFIAYYGYGSGVVRLSLGDNEEMGGANRGGGVYWNFIHNATVTVRQVRMLVKRREPYSGSGYMIQPTTKATARKDRKTNTP